MEPIKESDLSNVKFFRTEAQHLPTGMFNLMADYRGHQFIHREEIHLPEMAKMDINTVEIHVRLRMMEKLLAKVNKAVKDGTI